MKQLIVNADLATFSGPEGPRAGAEMRSLGLIRGGAVLMDGGKIVSSGLKELVLKHPDAGKARLLDAGGRLLLPGFVDCHTHPVFAEPRLRDYGLRAQGKTYEEIAAEGGGIVSSVRAVRGASQEDLARGLFERARRFLECGTTTLEAKSGYGLDPDSELKMLRAMKAAAAGSPLEILPTFLGAHAVPPEYAGRTDDYVRLLVSEVLPVVAREGLARFADAFCEEGYFSPEQAEFYLKACQGAGLGLRLHAEQFTRCGGALLAARLGALSADHLDRVEDNDLAALKAAGVVACLVPGSNHFLGLSEFPPARRIIDAGVPVALATDFNPGTCPCWNLQEILSIAVSRMRMTPEEALCAVTVNAAHALGLGKTHGRIQPGMQADLVLFDCQDPRELPYWFGANLAVTVFKRGNVVHSTEELRF
ncbi:MAG TPA: imidazolonepropionase [Elusimicrobia bacterium]|nr:imidazolonepropionase [Elusimicrobiota bacterium]